MADIGSCVSRRLGRLFASWLQLLKEQAEGSVTAAFISSVTIFSIMIEDPRHVIQQFACLTNPSDEITCTNTIELIELNLLMQVFSWLFVKPRV